jgi:protein-tyrosine kinase
MMGVMLDDSRTSEGASVSALSDEIVTVRSPRSGTAESCRALRTHVVAQHMKLGRRALAICGPTPGIGASFISANLAVALSQIGVQTLLIDVNLRRPSLDRWFGVDSNTPGLQQCLSDPDADFSDFIRTGTLPNLSLMFAGGAPPNPQELLATDRFAEMIRYCLRQYDMTIVDTPPASTCSDVHRISTVMGYSLLVTRRDKTLLSDVQTLAKALERDGAKVIGTVMTEV